MLMCTALAALVLATVKARAQVTTTLDQEELDLDKDEQLLDERKRAAVCTRIHLLYALGTWEQPKIRECARARAPRAGRAGEDRPVRASAPPPDPSTRAVSASRFAPPVAGTTRSSRRPACSSRPRR